ncbi:MAG TPA: hypothetical protein PKU67_05785 [Candidatus Hydrothermia bacterium]|nr:hypothetical protein [Candidatus Hydrothermia bacterium]MDD5573236.1 hypothetical protein [Candidatus Hydrothermia bacterium]HOK23516.1 hypothetical protein [Candidatus Hydrothermia bacterium]HOL24255.1 hypothetical protein [Candidatus Hydrothermia bacterium]HPO79174.1 hypothetical protein [Candidatus Hydrothermia bacterium]
MGHAEWQEVGYDSCFIFVRFIKFNKEMGMKRYILIALVLSVAILRALPLNGVPIYTGT